VLEWLLNTPKAEPIQQLLHEHNNICAPELIDIEIAQVLRRYHLNQGVQLSRCHEALEDFYAMPLFRYSHRELLPLVWELRDNISAYDAAFVALAELLDVPLITTDRKLANAPKLPVTVVCV